MSANDRVRLTKWMRASAVSAVLGLVPACSADKDEDHGHHGGGVHMAELSDDLTKIYLTASDKNRIAVVDTRSLGADTSPEGLKQRAYVVSRDSEEIAVIDLRTLELVRKSDYQTLQQIPVGAHPTHLSLSRDGKLLAVMDEEEGAGAVSFIETATDREVKRLSGFQTPHYMRFAHDNAYGYVANIGAHHITRVDMAKLEIDGHIPLDGFEVGKAAPDEGGFGDAQIDARGILFAAHHASGRVLVYDTNVREKRQDLVIGGNPWMAYAEHPFQNVIQRHLVTNFGQKSVQVIDAAATAPSVLGALPGDEESYGVNYSSRAPNKAFVMNRIRQDVAVVDMNTLNITKRIPVGGNTETAATTADGKYIVATVSSANRVVIIDAETDQIIKTFDGVGNYPWSVTIPGGQNYCH
ncbi:MAG: cytochrome D1 domain-containing protein [Polyangiales bacterium]